MRLSAGRVPKLAWAVPFPVNLPGAAVQATGAVWQVISAGGRCATL